MPSEGIDVEYIRKDVIIALDKVYQGENLIFKNSIYQYNTMQF